jgi:hypothetical protein
MAGSWYRSATGVLGETQVGQLRVAATLPGGDVIEPRRDDHTLARSPGEADADGWSVLFGVFAVARGTLS